MSCNRVNGVSVSATSPPLILVSALCNFKVSVGSQRYIRVYFNIQVSTLLWCNVFSFSFWQIVANLGFCIHNSGVALKNCGERPKKSHKFQFLHNVGLIPWFPNCHIIKLRYAYSSLASLVVPCNVTVHFWWPNIQYRAGSLLTAEDMAFSPPLNDQGHQRHEGSLRI